MKKNLFLRLALVGLLAGSSVMAGEHRLPNQPVGKDGYYIVKWDCEKNTWAESNGMEYDETFVLAIDLTGTPYESWVKNAQSAGGVNYPVDNTVVSLNTFLNDRGNEYTDNRARLWHIRDNIYGAMYNFAQFEMKNGGNNPTPAIGAQTKIYTRIFESATLFSDRCFPITPSADYQKGSVWSYKDEWYSAKDNEPFFVFAPYTGTKTGAEFTTEEQTPGTYIFYDKDHYVVSKGYSAPCSVNDDQCCPFFFPLDPKTQTVPVGKDTVLVAKEKSGNLTGVKYQWYYYETSKGESTAVKYTGQGGTSKTCHPNTSVDGSDYTYYCFITTDNCPDGVYTTYAQVIVQNPCPKYTWTIDGVEGLDTPLYPGGYYDITCTCESGAPTVTITGNNIQVGTQTTSGKTVSMRVTVLGDAQKTDKITFKATHEATTAFKSCDDIHEIPVGNCENGLAYTMQGFNGNGKYVIADDGKVILGTAVTDKTDMWQPISTGEQVNGNDVFYLRNVGTGEYLYRGPVQDTKNDNIDFAEPLTSAVNGMTADYKWFFHREGGDKRYIYLMNVAGWTGNWQNSFALHNRGWADKYCKGGNEPKYELRICDPEMKVGELTNYSGSSEMRMENDPYNTNNWQLKEVYEAPEHIQTTIGWNGTAPVSPVELSAGGTCTYTGKRTDAIHSINQTFTYTSSDPSIATVDATTGTVTAVASGTVTITAKLEDVGCFDGDTITYQVKVKGCSDFTWAIDGTEGLETKMYPGGWYMVSCTSEDGAPTITVTGTGVTTETATKKDNTTTMKVILSGTATGDMAFKATFKASGLDCKDEQSVTVSQCPETHFTTTVDWNGTAPEAKVEASIGDEMTYAIKRTDEVHSINAAITYTSSNEEVATVDANGKVIVKGPGTTTITATLEDAGCFDGADKTYEIHVKGCPEFTWMTDGTAADWEKDKMYPGGWYLVSCTTEDGAPEITVSGTGVKTEAVSKTGNTTTIKVILTGEAQPKTDITFTASLTTGAGLSCSDVQKLTISECTTSGVESRKIEWFNYNKPGEEWPQYWIHDGAPVFLRDNEGVLEADIEHSDGLDQWYIIPTGEQIAGQNVFYMQNVKTLKYVYRGSVHGNQGGDWEYAEALLNSTLPTSDNAKKDYKWVLYEYNNDTAIVCANGFTGTDAEFKTNHTAYTLHVRNWEASGLFSNPNIPKPRMVCGKTAGETGSPVFYYKGYTITKPVVTFATEVKWKGTAPADTVDVTKGGTYTYTIERKDTLHSINEKITYESNNPSFATVDPTTGQVTIVGDEGEATITASLEGVGCFDGAELSYVVRIIRVCPEYTWTIDGQADKPMYAGGWYEIGCTTQAGAPDESKISVSGTGVSMIGTPITTGDVTTFKIYLDATATGDITFSAENFANATYKVCPKDTMITIADCPTPTPAELQTKVIWTGTAPVSPIEVEQGQELTFTAQRDNNDGIHSYNSVVTYSCEVTDGDANFATVDATTGKVTINGDKGKAIITATLEDIGCFKGASISYEVQITTECPYYTWYIDGNKITASQPAVMYAGGWYILGCTTDAGAPTKFDITGNGITLSDTITMGDVTTIKVTLSATASGEIKLRAENKEVGSYILCPDSLLFNISDCPATTPAELMTTAAWVGTAPEAIIYANPAATYTYTIERTDAIHSINKDIHYESTNTTVATVDATTGVVTVNEEESGETTIMAILEDAGCFKGDTLSYVIKMKECPEVTWTIDGQAGLTKPLYAGGWYEISATAVTGAPTLTITGTDVVAEAPTTSGNTTTVKITLLGTATGDITMQAANAEAETYKACTDEQIVAMASCAAATEAEIQTALRWVGQTPDAVITTKKGATYTYAAERSDELHSINKTITYTSSDETVATVDNNGHVQVIAELGEATITVELEEVGCFKSAVLTYIIKAHPDYLTFDDNNGTGVWSAPLNWWPDYNRLPNETDSATIAAPCQVDITSARTYYLTFTVADGYDITVLPTGALTIVGTLTNATDGDILIQSNENGTGTFVMSELNTNVPAEVQFYCRAFDGDKDRPTWQYIGMPLKDNTKPATWYTAPNAQYYTWGDTPNMVVGGNWEERTGNATYSLPQFNGICLTQQEKTTYTYKGLLCDPQTRNVGLPLNNQGEYPMFCFVANSWTAPIRIADLENSDFEDADATVYIMNTGTFKEARNQQGNESLTGQAKLNGQYNAIPVHAAPYLSDALQVIPSMQGFFVRRQGQVNTTSPTNLSLDYKKLIYDVNYNLSTESARAPRRAAAEDGIRTLHLMVENAYWADAVDMLEGEAFTEGFDQGWDGRKMQGHDTKVSLSVQTVDGNMAVAALNDWENVPLAFKGMKGLPYTFTISNVDATDLYLYDQLTDTYTALQNGATYSFEAGKSEENDRFYIRRIAAKQGSQNSEEVVPSIDGKYIIHGHLMIVQDGVWYNAVGTKMHNLQ
ncbi:MAG: Ig-like domain-containing protein [Bacteroidales bacterium]|nr:Ig-like domain-containing protein [Bacteroidales bacterium]